MKVKCTILIILLFGITNQIVSQSLIYQDENGVTFKWKVKKGNAVIKSFNRDVPIVRIPSEIEFQGTTYSVNQIDTYVSGDNYATEQLIIPSSVTIISNYAFNEFRKLKVVQLPDNLQGKVNKAFRKGVEFVSDLSEYKQNMSAQNGSVLTASVKEPPQEEKVISDIDVNIPHSNDVAENTYCVIIANEHYDKVPNVDYALSDGNSFRTYCESTLGVPKEHVEYLEDATYGNMLEAFAFIKSICAVHPSPKSVKVLVYYAGHGFNTASDKDTYLLPKDGNPNSKSSCIKLNDIYDKLGKLNVQCIMFFIDACFSGMQRGNKDKPLVAARTIGMAPKKDKITGNLLVFSATSSDETAMSYHAQRHGLFTYYLLRELQKTKGKTDLGRLVEEVINNVRLNSLTINRKNQTPNVNVSSAMADSWKDINLKE